jgi:hypothetical protein
MSVRSKSKMSHNWGNTNDFNKEWDGGKQPVNYLITEECNTMNIN